MGVWFSKADELLLAVLEVLLHLSPLIAVFFLCSLGGLLHPLLL